jgi:prepilin-type processing-associated H-X9-DG protein
MQPSHRRGYTWVELVVVAFVILLLVAMVLPAVQQVRTPRRRNVCLYNMRQLGFAVLNYDHSQGAYPGYLSPLPRARDGSDQQSSRVTWVVKILPLLERGDLYQLYRNPPAAGAHEADPRRIYLDVLVCPNAVASNGAKTSPPPCNYVVNTGRADVIAQAETNAAVGYPADWRANGVFFNHFHDNTENPTGAPLVSITQEFISEHDGSSLTVMLSERTDAGSYSFPPASALETEASLGFVWWPTKNARPPFRPPHDSQRINGPSDALSINRARPSSNHRSGVNVLFCDGHARSISDDIDYGVWCLLMTPNGRACNAPGKTELELAGPDNNYDFLRNTNVDESQVQ